MKRMNLKKAISLMSFVLVMFFGIQTASAQMAESTAAIEVVHARINTLKSQAGSAVMPTDAAASNDMATVVEIKYLQVVAAKIKGGSSTMSAIDAAYSQYTANLSAGNRLTMMNAVKQDVITALTIE